MRRRRHRFRMQRLGDILLPRDQPTSLVDCVIMVRKTISRPNGFASSNEPFPNFQRAMQAARRAASQGFDVEVDRSCLGLPAEELVTCRGKRPGRAAKCTSAFQRSKRQLCPDCY